MGRRYKPIQETVHYHVMTRTAQLKYWLEDEPEVKAYWIELLKFYSRVFYIEILAKNILSNHFHLCLTIRRPPIDPADVLARHELANTRLKNPRKLQPELIDRYYQNLCDISKFMATINQRTALFYNRRKGTKGHFWGDRFKSKVIDSESYLINTMTYIELNSVRAGLATKPENYPYSSLAEIKKAIESKAFDPTPRIGCLKRLPDFKRGKAYIELTNYLHEATINGKSHRSTMIRFIERLVGREGIELMISTTRNGTPSDWSKQTFQESLEGRRSTPAAPI